MPIAAVSFGACLIEKHFTLSRSEGGVDSQFSLEPKELEALVVESKRAWQSIGEVTYGPTAEENSSFKFRRSVYVSADINKGEPFSKENIRVVRPGYGCSPDLYESIIGTISKKDFKAGRPLHLSDLL